MLNCWLGVALVALSSGSSGVEAGRIDSNLSSVEIEKEALDQGMRRLLARKNKKSKTKKTKKKKKGGPSPTRSPTKKTKKTKGGPTPTPRRPTTSASLHQPFPFKPPTQENLHQPFPFFPPTRAPPPTSPPSPPTPTLPPLEQAIENSYGCISCVCGLHDGSCCDKWTPFCDGISTVICAGVCLGDGNLGMTYTPPVDPQPWMLNRIRELPASEGEYCGSLFASVLECNEAEGLSCSGDINDALTFKGIGYCVKDRPALIPSEGCMDGTPRCDCTEENCGVERGWDEHQGICRLAGSYDEELTTDCFDPPFPLDKAAVAYWNAKRLKDAGISLVAFDFDQTSTSLHTFQGIYPDWQYVIDRMLPDFLLQVRYNHQLGLNQAMVSFNSNGRTIIGGQLSGGSEMIATLLRASLPANVANSIAVVAFSPSGSTFVGKEQHLTIAKKHFGNLENRQTVLIDENVDNCKKAKDDGYYIMPVVIASGFRVDTLFSALGGTKSDVEYFDADETETFFSTSTAKGKTYDAPEKASAAGPFGR